MSHLPCAKSGSAIMLRRIEMFVWMPTIRMSCNALFAFWITSCQVAAVTTSFAIKLSKSGVTAADTPFTRFVSILIPFPDGKWKDWIFPTLNDQFLVGSSAVIRNCREQGPGTCSGSLRSGPIPAIARGYPCAIRSCTFTMSMRRIDSVTVCST